MPIPSQPTMEVIILLILASLMLAGLFLLIFVWATRTGQFEDTSTPALRMLTDDAPAPVRRDHVPGAPAHLFSTRTQNHP